MLKYEYQSIGREQIIDCYTCKQFTNLTDGLTIISLFAGVSGFETRQLQITEAAISEDDTRQQTVFNAIPKKKALITEYESKDITVAVIEASYFGDDIAIQIWFSKKLICFINPNGLKSGIEQYPRLSQDLDRAIFEHFTTLEITNKRRYGSRCIAECNCKYASDEASGIEIIYAASNIRSFHTQYFAIRVQGVNKSSPEYGNYTYGNYESAEKFISDHAELDKSEILCAGSFRENEVKFVFFPSTLSFKIIWDDNITSFVNELLIEWNSEIYHWFNKSDKLPDEEETNFVTATQTTIHQSLFESMKIPQKKKEYKEEFEEKKSEDEKRKKAKNGDVFSTTEELGKLMYKRIYEFYNEPITFVVTNLAHKKDYFVMALGENIDCPGEEIWLLAECSEETAVNLEKQAIPIRKVFSGKQLYKIVWNGEEYRALFTSLNTLPAAMLPGEEEMLKITEI